MNIKMMFLIVIWSTFQLIHLPYVWNQRLRIGDIQTYHVIILCGGREGRLFKRFILEVLQVVFSCTLFFSVRWLFSMENTPTHLSFMLWFLSLTQYHCFVFFKGDYNFLRSSNQKKKKARRILFNMLSQIYSSQFIV